MLKVTMIIASILHHFSVWCARRSRLTCALETASEYKIAAKLANEKKNADIGTTEKNDAEIKA